jgi:hypothetical protein
MMLTISWYRYMRIYQERTAMQVTLDWLQTTFATFCDGDWEHYYGITIETLDNPGWRVTIDLVDTDLAPHAFPPVDYAANEQDWVHCRVREGRFEGFGGPYNLTDILRLFRTWVDSTLQPHVAFGE